MSKKLTAALVCVAIVVVGFVAMAVVLHRLDTRQLISERIYQATGHHLTLQSSELQLRWSLQLVVTRVAWQNRAWASTPYMFTAERITARLSTIDLLFGRLTLTNVQLLRPRLWIEREPDGTKYNLDFRRPTQPPTTIPSGRLAEFLARLNVRRVSVTDGRIDFLHPNRHWEFAVDSALLQNRARRHPIKVRVTGAIADTPIVVRGTVDHYAALLSYQPVDIDLTGHFGSTASTFTMEGVIGDLLRWQALDLHAQGRSADLREWSTLVGRPLPEYNDIVGQARLRQPTTASSLRLDDIQLQSNDYGMATQVHGSIANMIDLREIDLRFHAAGPFTHPLLTPYLADELAVDAVFAGRVTGHYNQLKLAISEARWTSDGVEVTARGDVDNLFTDWTTPLSLTLMSQNITDFARVFGRDWTAEAKLHATAELTRADGQYALTAIHAYTDSPALQFTARGAIENLGRAARGTIDFSIDGERTLIRQLTANPWLHLLDTVSVRTTLHLQEQQLKLHPFHVHGQGDGIELRGVGADDSMPLLKGFVVAFDGELLSLDKLSPLVTEPLPPTQPLTLSALLIIDDTGQFGLQKINIKANDPNITAHLQGEIAELGADYRVDIAAKVAIHTALGLRLVDALIPELAAGPFLQPLLPLQSSAHLYYNHPHQSDLNLGYSLEQIRVESAPAHYPAQLNGALTNVIDGPIRGQLNLQLNGNLDAYWRDYAMNTDPVSDAAVARYGRELRGDMHSNMVIVFTRDGLQLHALEVAIASAQSTLTARAAVLQWLPFHSKNLHINIEAKPLGDLFNGALVPFNLTKPATAQFTLHHHKNQLSIATTVDIDASDLSGKITITRQSNSQAKAKKVINLFDGAFSSTLLDFNEILNESPPRARLFSNQPLPLDWLDTTSGQLDLRVAQLETPLLPLTRVHSTSRVAAQTLVTSIMGESEHGDLRATITVDKTPEHYLATVDLSGHELDIVTANKQDEQPEHGHFSIDIQLQGAGNSIAEMAATANGTMLSRIRDIRIHARRLRRVSQDLFLGLLDTINLVKKKRAYTDVECSTLKLDIQHGMAVADPALVIKTKKFTLLGGGTIDLASEKIDFTVTSRARTGFGINANTLVKFADLGGTIKEPNIQPNASGLFQTGFALWAAIFSGGSSLLAQGLYDKNKANSDVCNLLASDELPDELSQ